MSDKRLSFVIKPESLRSQDKLNAEENASFFSKLVFSYSYPLVKLAKNKNSEGVPLRMEDLGNLSTNYTTSHLKAVFDGEDSLYNGLKKVILPDLKGITGLAFINVVADVTFTILFNNLITYIEDGEFSNVQIGYWMVIGMVLTRGIQSISKSQFYYRVFRGSNLLQSVVTTVLYDKILNISLSSRQEKSVGEIINILQSDTRRLSGILNGFSNTFPSILQSIVVMALLVHYVGVVAFAGLACLIVSMILNVIVMKHVFKLYGKVARVRDERIRVTNEYLQGIKGVKMAGWEENILEQIGQVRKRERKILIKKELFLSTSLGTVIALPELASAATIALLAVTGQPLTAANIFTVLVSFDLLRNAVIELPFAISGLLDAKVSYGRIKRFMELDETEDHEQPPSSEQLSEPTISNQLPSTIQFKFQDAEYFWSVPTGDTKPVLSGITCEIQRSKLTAIIGPVGVGKSAFCCALLKELEQGDGQFQSQEESVAYVPQTAWILNGTLKSNILFGQPFDESRYKKVLEICQLTKDLEVLPSGDMTLIGERGVNLSGGQKQRISIARAAYSNRQTVIMDDPLSALDPAVAQRVFQDCIKTYLKGKTIVLVTCQTNVLNQCDWIIVFSTRSVNDIGTEASVESLNGHKKSNEHITPKEVVKHGLNKQAATKESQEEDIHVVVAEEDVPNDVNKSETAFIVTKNSANDTSNEKEVVNPGYISKQGSFETLVQSGINFSNLIQQTGLQKHDETSAKKIESPVLESPTTEDEHQDGVDSAETSNEEEQAIGHVKLSNYTFYIKGMGGYVVFLTIMTISLLNNGFNVFVTKWLGLWAEAAESDYNTSALFVNDATSFDDAEEELYYYLYVYVGCAFGLILFQVIKETCFAIAGLRAGKALHQKLLLSVLSSTMSFFDTTPTGRIISRFSHDTQQVDEDIHGVGGVFIEIMGVLVFSMFAMASATPFILVTIPFITVFYVYMMKLYLPVNRDLKRLSSINLSPLNAHFSETLGGLDSIRAYSVGNHFRKKQKEQTDDLTLTKLDHTTCEQWVSIRMQLIGVFVTLVAGVLAVFSSTNGIVTASEAAFSLSFASSFTFLLIFGVRTFARFESIMSSVERMRYYTENLEQEPVFEKRLIPDWPKTGKLVVNNLSMRYRKDTPLVLKGISFQVEPGHRVGIVGRTGSGKSSLIVALLRLVECESHGSMFLDGIDLSSLSLHQVRKSIGIVPQNPVVFSGTIRSNMDPFNEYKDSDIWMALEKCQMKQTISRSPKGLMEPVAEYGSNFSQGELQLLSLSRALLEKQKLILLDEATSSVDFETDNRIQATLRSAFDGCTMLIIAHRLNTIIDSDKVLVLGDGKLIEYDTPRKLLSSPSSALSEMTKF